MSPTTGGNLDQDVALAFGRALRAVRISAGLTQEEVGLRANVQRKHVSSLELGHKVPNLATAFSLASALEIELVELIRRTEEELAKIYRA
jgi:transcriptional regulator with XRE-family HTH domain